MAARRGARASYFIPQDFKADQTCSPGAELVWMLASLAWDQVI